MEDREIVELYWQRSERAIAETDSKYGRLCMHLCGNMLQSREDAEECVNDTYLAAWNTMPTEKPNVLSAYILKITRNLALKKIEYNTAKNAIRRWPCRIVNWRMCFASVKAWRIKLTPESWRKRSVAFCGIGIMRKE